MSSELWSGVRVALLLVGASPGAVQPAEIDHRAVGCVVAEKYPSFEARLMPADAVSRARVYFRAEGGPAWYAVAMKREGDVFVAALPKPKKSLKRFQYYLEVADTAAATSRTQDYMADVMSGPGACAKGMMSAVLSAASVLLEVPPGALPIPAGFSGAGVIATGSTATVAGSSASGGGAAAGGAAAGAAAAGAAAGGGGGLGAGVIVGIGAAAAAGAVVAVKAASGGGGRPVQISGQVFARLGLNPSGGPGIYQDPVVGGVVSTSLDSTTATTDGEGRFRLVTGAEVSDSDAECYTLTITAAGLPTYSLRGGWGRAPENQRFTLIPPNPSTIPPCGGR